MMSKTIWKSLLAAPALLGATVAMSAIVNTSTAVNAAEATGAVGQVTTADRSTNTTPPVAPAASLSQVAAYSAEGSGAVDASQVTSVSQLSDVKPTDWAFQALQSLVERYGCIVGYPDKTYRGNRALTRYEFAAGLNACMDRINELIAAGTADLVKKEDLLAVQKLQEEFAAELATLRGRVDALEVRTATLEKQQFSTTTKLNGEVIFSIADTFGDRAVRSGNGTRLGSVAAGVTRDDKTETVFSDRVRLAFDTSFTGKDRLRTRLNARNTQNFSGNFTGTNMTRLSYDGGGDNAVGVDKLYYRFALGDNLRIQIDAINDEVYDGLISSLSPFESSGSGSISRFGRFSPILRVNNPGTSGSAGVTFAYKFSDALRLEGGYVSDTASNDPSPKNGLFNGSYAALGQVVFAPSKALTLGLIYAHSYYPGSDINLTGSTGTAYAIAPFGARVATAADSVGGSVQFKLSPKFSIGGWAAASFAHRRSNSDNATVLSAAAYLALPDLGKKGNLGGILVGIAPTVLDNEGLTANRQDADTPFHVEAFYRYRLTDNISITPGVFVLFNPEGNSSNATQFVGVLRTTFTF
jgi:Carbohydrate-selective porin, OprB family/S-layer homology domain